ncbi:MAG: TAXI family TRAP transporter solute-binding subunit [Proteobacteria bacterium]|nr:TAXI family TRAP transporter solute-binding subunit [Pseudomonadota bacterium]
METRPSTCMRRGFVASIVAVLASVAVGAGAGSARAQESVVIVPGLVGGIGFQFVTGMVNAAASDIQKTKAQVSISASGGFGDNAVRVHRGMAQVGVITEQDLTDIQTRGGKFAAPGEPVVVLFPLYSFVWHAMVKRESPIQSMSDLKGKKINVQPVGAATRTVGEAIFKALGITYTPFALAHSESADSLLSGAVDVITNGGINPVHMAMAAKTPVRVIPFTAEETAKVNKELSWLQAIKDYDFGRFYPGAGKATVMGMWTQMAASLKLSDEVAEALTYNAYKNRKVMENAHSLAKEMDPAQILETSIKIHPGAARAYARLGVTIPADKIAKR